MALVGMDELIVRNKNAEMFGAKLWLPAKQNDVACRHVEPLFLSQMPPRRFVQDVVAACLRPVRAIGPDRLRLAAIQSAPDPAHQAEAVASNILQRRLMAVGRADPASGLRDDLLGNIRSRHERRAVEHALPVHISVGRVIARQMRKALKIALIGELRLAGRKRLVAARDDGKPVADGDGF